MINHVVLFKLNKYENLDEKQTVLNQFKIKLLNLKEFIPQLRFIEVSTNYQLNAASYDLCLITHFDSINDLKIYQVHPEHLKVAEYLNDIVSERAAVDYEL